jgi:hypothetical protein
MAGVSRRTDWRILFWTTAIELHRWFKTTIGLKPTPLERRYLGTWFTRFVIAWDIRGRALRPNGLGLLLSDKYSAKEEDDMFWGAHGVAKRWFQKRRTANCSCSSEGGG